MAEQKQGIAIPKTVWSVATERICHSPSWVGNGAWMIRRDVIRTREGDPQLPTTEAEWRVLTPKILKPPLELEDHQVEALIESAPPSWEDKYKLEPTSLTMTPHYTAAAPLPVSDMAHCLIPHDPHRGSDIVWLRKIWSERFLMLGFAYQDKANSTIFIVNPARRGDVTPLAMVCPYGEGILRDSDTTTAHRLTDFFRLLNGVE